MILPIYLRREPTRDPIVLRYDTERRPDVVAYKDPECRVPVARWPWYFKRPDRRNRHITLNCYQWKAIWLPEVVVVAA